MTIILRKKELVHLLNKLNKVTSCHRHGRDIPEQYLDDLCNAQVEYEQSDLTELEELIYSIEDFSDDDAWMLRDMKETVLHRLQIKKSKWPHYIQAFDKLINLIVEEKERRT